MNLKSLYTIVEKEHQNDLSITITVRLDKNHQLFDGHFPGHQILPGVITLQIIKELTEIECNTALFMYHAKNIKFLSIVDPNQNELLLFNLQLQKENDSIEVKNSTTFTDGTVVMKSTTVYSTKH